MRELSLSILAAVQAARLLSKANVENGSFHFMPVFRKTFQEKTSSNFF